MRGRRSSRIVPAAAPGGRPLPLTPLKLRAQDREEVLLRKADEAGARGRLPNLHPVVLPQREPLLAVDRKHHILVGQQRDLDARRAGQHHRAVGEGVGADGGDHDGVHGREEDGPAGRERVRRGTGRRCDDEAVGAVRGRVLPFHRHGQVDDSAHRGLGDHHIVERDVLGESLTPAHHPGGEHHPVVEHDLAREHGVQRREQLLERGGRQEAEPAEVDAEDRHARVADHARHRQEGAVPAEDHDEIHVSRELRPGDDRGSERGHEPGGFLLDDGHAAAPREPLDQPGDHPCRLRAVRPRDDADPLHARASTLLAMSPSRLAAVRPCDDRCRRNSRFPFGPLSGDAVTPRTCQPRITEKRASREMTAWCCPGSRTTPPLPTAPRPTSNCGFTSATSSPPGASRPNAAGRTFSSEMNETSTVTTSGASAKRRGSSARAFICSMTTTRGSLRSLTSSCPDPTSIAKTLAAPRWSRQSVKPPVEAPTSAQILPRTSTLNVSRACTSFSPPRLTYGARPRTSISESVEASAPALSTRRPSTITSPARISRTAFSRDSASPRSTSS